MFFNFLVLILISFALAFIAAPFYIGLLYKFNLRRITKPDLDDKLPDRAVKLGTPVMGGFLITSIVFLITFFYLRNWNFQIPALVILFFGSLFGAIDEYINTIGKKGFSFAVREAIDSAVSKRRLLWEIYKLALIPWNVFKEIFRIMGSTQRGLKTHEKFLMQLVICAFGAWWVYTKLGLHSFWVPLAGNINLGIVYPVLVVFLALGYANAFGVTDGLDGLSAGTHSISFLAYGALALYFKEYSLAFFLAAIVGSELAFLYFNIFPARVEMSDVGTLPLGILFVFSAVLLRREITLPIIGFIFTIEILSSFIQQWSAKLRHGKRVFLLAPIHHHFEKLGWPETKVTTRFWLVCALFSLLGMSISLL